MTRFYYEVVSHNGCGIYATGFSTLAAAQRRARMIAEHSPTLGPFEILQVRERNGSRRYWIREGSRWVGLDARRGIDVRKPDWRWPAEATA